MVIRPGILLAISVNHYKNQLSYWLSLWKVIKPSILLTTSVKGNDKQASHWLSVNGYESQVFGCLYLWVAWLYVYKTRHLDDYLCETVMALHWRHNGHDSISNHQPHDCLLNGLFRRRSKKISKLHVTGLCAGNSPETCEFPQQMASNAENVSIWWNHTSGSTSPQSNMELYTYCKQTILQYQSIIKFIILVTHYEITHIQKLIPSKSQPFLMMWRPVYSMLTRSLPNQMKSQGARPSAHHLP